LRRAASYRLPAALAALLIGGAGLAGWLAGRSPDAGERAGLSAGRVELTPPTGWRDGGTAVLHGLRPADALTATDDRKSGLLAGVVDGVLPARLASRISARPPEPVAVRAGALEAYRWRSLPERGNHRLLTLFAAPTDDGLVSVACYGPASARAVCERAVGSLSVPGAATSPLAELDAWSERLDRTFARLNPMRSAQRSRLRAAPTRRRQARVASQLAGAHRDAARALSRGAVPQVAARAQRSVVHELNGIAASYRGLGHAARRGDRRAYRSARRSVSRREAALQRLLRGL
jgi:hypothetical protein